MELHLPIDYEDLLRELVASKVDFMLVGGWAVAVHGHGRATDDMDVFVAATPENAARVMNALRAFGAPIDQHQVSEGLFASERYGYRMGRKPLLIEAERTRDDQRRTSKARSRCRRNTTMVGTSDEHGSKTQHLVESRGR